MPLCERFARTEIISIEAFFFMGNRHTKCQINGCNGKGNISKLGLEYFNKGYCNNHYYKYKKYGDAKYGEKEKYTKCKVEGCDNSGSKIKEHHNEIFVLGYCSVHYGRFRKYGDPNVLKIVKGVRVKDNPLYSCYNGMKSRCYNTKEKKYRLYGGRGIKICDRWLGKTDLKIS